MLFEVLQRKVPTLKQKQVWRKFPKQKQVWRKFPTPWLSGRLPQEKEGGQVKEEVTRMLVVGEEPAHVLLAKYYFFLSAGLQTVLVNKIKPLSLNVLWFFVS